ncbi:MAG TPA: tRNA adenosine(34) deaminase TadA [Bryobacteraceae bacterium]|nr:tRNA adenosine(34) deaminase TadA [Bryobacteraceae bacterium]
MPPVVPTFSKTDNPHWSDLDLTMMSEALSLARQALKTNETPVGAVLVQDGSIIGRGFNRPIAACDPTAHAEIEALRTAALRQSNYRLGGTTLYVTLEPCVMCAGAIVAARVRRLVFGARDIRYGAIRSKFQLADSELLNHRAIVEEGLLAVESSELLSSFFAARRNP